MIVAQLGPNLKFKKGRPHQVLFRFSVISGSPAEVTGTSAPGVEADVIGGKADIPVLLPSSSTKGKTFSAKGPKFSARIWKNISVRMPDSTATCDLAKLMGYTHCESHEPIIQVIVDLGPVPRQYRI